MTHQKPTPTHETYEFLETLFDLINLHLYDGELPRVLFTLQRQKRVFGYFHFNRFVSVDGSLADEIAVNPEFFATHGFTELCQTITHEMAHQWQAHFGNPSQRTYHNKEWSAKCESLGLMPSSTGKPGGKKVGQKMADYIIEGGRLAELVKSAIADGKMILWFDRFVSEHTEAVSLLPAPAVQQMAVAPATVKTNSKTKFSHTCLQSKKIEAFWGVASLEVDCRKCGTAFVAEKNSSTRNLVV